MKDKKEIEYNIIHHSKLKTGNKYRIDGDNYTYDGYSTFWNLRMIDKNGELQIFPQKTEIKELK